MSALKPVDAERIEKTFFWDRFRGILFGVVEMGWGGFTLVVAISVFAAPDSVKALVAAAWPLGLLLNPLSLSLFARMGRPAGEVAAWISALAGGLILVSALVQSLVAFLIASCLGFALAAQVMPLLLHIWSTNYPAAERGRLLSTSIMLSVASTFVASIASGWVMDRDLSAYSFVLIAIACSLFGLGFVMARMPSEALSEGESQNPLRNFSYAVEDKVFGVMLISWMFLGFGNLMVLPLRVEYMLQPQYGIEASATVVMAMTVGIPAAFRFATVRIWGRLFDRIDFLKIRMAINCVFVVAIFLFLTTKSLWVMAFASAILGIANAGGSVSWSLWVTKFATPERAPAYMSVHTFSTGLRGIVAPFLGFYLLASWGATGTAILGSSLVAFSVVIILMLALVLKRRTQAASKPVA